MSARTNRTVSAPPVPMSERRAVARVSHRASGQSRPFLHPRLAYPPVPACAVAARRAARRDSAGSVAPRTIPCCSHPVSTVRSCPSSGSAATLPARAWCSPRARPTCSSSRCSSRRPRDRTAEACWAAARARSRVLGVVDPPCVNCAVCRLSTLLCGWPARQRPPAPPAGCTGVFEFIVLVPPMYPFNGTRLARRGETESERDLNWEQAAIERGVGEGGTSRDLRDPTQPLRHNHRSCRVRLLLASAAPKVVCNTKCFHPNICIHTGRVYLPIIDKVRRDAHSVLEPRLMPRASKGAQSPP